MKFYYNGKLLRTSKTHVYTHALVDGLGRCVMCSATKEGCEKELRRLIGWENEAIENEKRALEAIRSGRKKYYYKRGRYTTYTIVDHTEEEYMEYIRRCERMVEFYKEHKIVELEAVA